MQYDDRLFENRNDGRGAWTIRWLLRRYEGRSPWNFCWRITLEQYAAAILIGLFIAGAYAVLGIPLFEDDQSFEYGSDGQPSEHGGSAELLGMIVLVSYMIAIGPVLETLTLQALPIIIARKFKAQLGMQVLISGTLFAAGHFTNPNSILSGFAAGIPGGLYLGFAFAYWQRGSPATAWWVTFVSHGLRNVLPTIAMIAA
ncbi:MAG: hypothetical protein OXT69_01345 [Candidatus Poribacteria bacterium]|nr:hypothetical protein [Candidatus Poribacteria bacterium]